LTGWLRFRLVVNLLALKLAAGAYPAFFIKQQEQAD
jgi:hypothetical protein